MTIDAYSLCPGGSGKKIRFCCPDLLPEFEKIDRMMEAEQFVACIEHIERLERKPANVDRACLLAIKTLVLRAAGQLEKGHEVAKTFAAKHPTSPIALAELAITTSLVGYGRDAMDAILTAMEQADGSISSRLFEAIGLVADFMLEEHHWIAGRALLQLALTTDRDDPQIITQLFKIQHAADVPLLVKDAHLVPPPTAGEPWQAEFGQVTDLLNQARWLSAEKTLAALAERVGDEPRVWKTLAIVRGWLADEPGAIAALERYASLPMPLEDAVEAQALAMHLSPDPFQDSIDVEIVDFAVNDAEKLQELLLSDRRLSAMNVDGIVQQDGPPPRAGFVLMDRPEPGSDAEITIDTIPTVMAQLLLYGKQTDREARLYVTGVRSDQAAEIEDLVRSTAGETIAGEPNCESMGQFSRSLTLTQRQWRLTRGMTRERLQELINLKHRRVVFEEWPQIKLGIFGDKSLAEAAADPANRVKALAAIMVFEELQRGREGPIDFNELRRQLGLPTLDPIDPTGVDLTRLPTIRLVRVIVDKLGDEDVLVAFRRGVVYDDAPTIEKYAREIIARPSLEKHNDRLRAYNALARAVSDPAEALDLIEQGRKASEAAGSSSAPWDLLELSVRFSHGNGQEALRLVRHIETQHIEEPGVAESLTRLLIGVGVLRPDGTPNMRGAPGPAPASAAAPPAEPGKLWTPEAERGGGGGKLWVPD